MKMSERVNKLTSADLYEMTQSMFRNGETVIDVRELTKEQIIELVYVMLRDSKYKASRFITKEKVSHIYQNIWRYTKESQYNVDFICLTYIMEFEMLTFCISTTTSKGLNEKKLFSSNGVFSYTENLTCPDFSELGYTFYKMSPNLKIKRVG